MKTLIVYTRDSYYKYEELYSKHIFEVKELRVLYVYTLSKITGEEVLVACFNTWDYFIIEEEY